jgi:hypothetical protein
VIVVTEVYSIKRHFMYLTQLVRDLEDKSSCRYDHRGYCQEHGWFNNKRECPQLRIKKLLKRD